MILDRRVAVVTAAGSGIGRAGALVMASEGARVIVAERDAVAAAETVHQILHAGGHAESVVTDVADDAQLASLVDLVIRQYGHIDILHNHAGIQIAGSLEQVEPAGMDASWRINVHAQFVLCRLVVPHMKAAGKGVILNTASNSGVFYDREMIAYTTSKHAVIAMTKQIAKDHARFGIRVNALCPGWVDTPFNDAFTQQMGGRDALLRYVAQNIPLGRFATAQEIAQSILFLVSDRSAYMTGHALVVDGGECL